MGPTRAGRTGMMNDWRGREREREGGGLKAAVDHVNPSQGIEFIQLLLARRQLCRHLAAGNAETAVFNGSTVFGFQARRTPMLLAFSFLFCSFLSAELRVLCVNHLLTTDLYPAAREAQVSQTLVF